jgi:hypothetical protein
MRTGHSNKKRKLITALFLLALAGTAGTAYAARMSCSFVGGTSGDISFPNIDLTTSGTVYGNVNTQVSFVCTKNQSYTITVNPVSGWTLQSGANSIPYTLGVAPSGSYAGAQVDLLVPSGLGASAIAQADYQSAPVASYANTSPIFITVSWGTGGAAGSIQATLPSGSVRAAVVDSCTAPVNGSMNFTIDPSGSGTLNFSTTDAGNTPPTVTCTQNAVHAVSCSSAHLNKLTIGNDGSTDPISYTITGCPSTITGGGISSPTPINFGISILQSAYQNAKAGPHSDTISVLVTY